jgi:hypothetical protein
MPILTRSDDKVRFEVSTAVTMMIIFWEMTPCGSDDKVHEIATVCLLWQQWIETSVWFDDVGISAFHSCVVVDLWQSLSDWRLLLSECVLVCRRENVGAGIRAPSVRKLLVSKKNCAGTPYSPDLAPNDFFSVPEDKGDIERKEF